MRKLVSGSIGSLLGLTASIAIASGSGGMPMPQSRMPDSTPAQRAVSAYTSGLDEIKDADRLQSEAEQQTDPGKQAKALKHAHSAYTNARRDFIETTRDAPQAPEGWNELGYTQRKLGDYDDALKSYERALTLRPGYPEVLEYRGEAYLGLGRLEDAKQAYLDLFAGHRALSDQLLTAMSKWVARRRQEGKGIDVAKLDDFDQWVQERTRIAAQTAALTREGTAASWH